MLLVLQKVTSPNAKRHNSQRVQHPEVQPPVELVVGESVREEDAAVAGTEVELQGERDVELVLQSEETVRTGFAVVDTPNGGGVLVRVGRVGNRIVARVARFQASDVGEGLPVVAEAAAQADKSVQTFAQPPFVHEVRGEVQRPQVRAIDVTVLGAQIDLDGEVLGGEGLVRHSLRGANGRPDAVFIRSLCVRMERDSCEKGDNHKDNTASFHNGFWF